jgi:hypothetical protein
LAGSREGRLPSRPYWEANARFETETHRRGHIPEFIQIGHGAAGVTLDALKTIDPEHATMGAIK